MNRGAFSGTRRTTRPFVEGGLTDVQSEALPEDESTQAVRFFFEGYQPPSSRYKSRKTSVPNRYPIDKRTPINWVTQTSYTTSRFYALAFSNNLWVVGGASGQLRTSTDAITWVTQTSNFGTSQINSIAYGNNLWMMVGSGGQIRTSTDTITWVTQTSNFGTSSIATVAYGNNIWVAAGQAGELRTSTDGITWVTRTSNFGTSNIATVVFGGGIFVAGGLAAQLRTSTDGITWVTRTSNFGTSNINGVAYLNNLWIAGGGLNPATSIRTSTDAITWVTRGGTGLGSPTSFAYGAGVWLAASNSLDLNASVDLDIWITIPNLAYVYQVLYAQSKFVMAGDVGHISTSIPKAYRYGYPAVNIQDINLFSGTGASVIDINEYILP